MAIDKSVNQSIRAFEASLRLNGISPAPQDLFAGIDLGTAYIVTAVVDQQGAPVAGVITHSRSSIRDGLVLDYVGAIKILQQQLEKLRLAGLTIGLAAAAFPRERRGETCRPLATWCRRWV